MRLVSRARGGRRARRRDRRCPAGRAVWLPYVAVDRIDEITERAGRLGASVLMEPREGPAGWRSVVATPAGGDIAFWQAKR